MRLVCPNCEAKYEVPDDAIPDTGRDVQCTNCGHSWYQMRGRTAAVAAPPEVTPEPVEAAAAPEPEAVSMPTADAAPEVVAASADVTPVADVVPDPEEDAATAPAEGLAAQADTSAEVVAEAAGEPAAEALAEAVPVDDPAPGAEGASDIEAAVSEAVATAAEAEADAAVPAEPEPQDMVEAELADTPEPETAAGAGADAAPAPGYAVDDSVLAILREEAEREADARRAEALESQTDLGIEAAIPAKAAALAEAKPSARRDLLPDVEEINSTLRPSEMQAEADGTPDFVAPPPEAPRGFRSGFLSLMTIAILGAALYLVAPRLGVMVPALSGPLEAYVSMIDSLRLGLDGMMRSATVAISDG